jgi:hypothetical protein
MTQPPRKPSLWRDFAGDWQRWNTAERIGAGCLLVAVVAEISIFAGLGLIGS